MPHDRGFGPPSFDKGTATAKIREFKATPDPRWETDFDKVLERAKTTHKVILAAFTGVPWCGPCVKLEKNVFKTAEFKNWWFGKVLLLSVNTSDIASPLPWPAQKYGITAVPTVLGLNSGGQVLGQVGGAGGGTDAAEKWIKEFESAVGLS